MSPTDLAPAYWIDMGAMAISTLAGVTVADDSAILNQLKPFLKGFTLLFWATATRWIPMLVILGFWRHAYKRYAFSYDPQVLGAGVSVGNVHAIR